MQIWKILVLGLLGFTLSAYAGDLSISPEKIILVSAFDEDPSVNIYFGKDQENYINVAVKAEYIKHGSELRSENSSFSDGLDSSATWGKVLYVSSSKHPTFTALKIVTLNMDAKMAVIQVAGKLINPDTEKYFNFEETSFEIKGQNFDQFSRFIGKEILTTTAEQRDQIEKMWGGALSAHQEKIENVFNQCKPDNYQNFAVYKVKDWLPKITRNTTKMNTFWEKFGNPITPEYDNIRKIVVAMTDLNITSIKMQSYLKNQKNSDLEFINNNLSEISKISSQYVEYQPKPKK